MKRTFKTKAELLTFLNEKAQAYKQTKDPSDFDDLLWDLGGPQGHKVHIKEGDRTLDYNELWWLFDNEGSIKFPKN